jgi:hypothetical protein
MNEQLVIGILSGVCFIGFIAYELHKEKKQQKGKIPFKKGI